METEDMVSVSCEKKETYCFSLKKKNANETGCHLRMCEKCMEWQPKKLQCKKPKLISFEKM